MRPALSPDASPKGFVSGFRGYSRPSRRDTAVVLCHFSPAGFRRLAENARTVVSDMRGSGIPVYSVELVHPGRGPSLEDPDLTVRSGSYMFHKENLMGLMLSRVPDSYSKVVFLDADVRFSDREWLDRASDALDRADVIQPMEWCFWSSTRDKISAGEQVARGRGLDVGSVHPGFATAARRDWLDRVGGLYDLAVVGNGDTCLWDAVARSYGLGFPEGSTSAYTSRYEGLRGFFERVASSSPRVGSLRGCFAGHLPHGTAGKRGYVRRHSILERDISVSRNADGVYEWNDASNNGPMLEYFRSRDEDNLTTQDSLPSSMDDETLSVFRDVVGRAEVYVEYGCGGSTALAFRESRARIVSVDTDRSWIETTLNFIPGDLERVGLTHVDLGEVGEWGFPKDRGADGSVYCSLPWAGAKGADLVLVDGRFRVACFANAMMEAPAGATVIFEGYFGRDHYGDAEKIAQPAGRAGRSAIFRVPANLDRNLAGLVLKRFARDPR